jgi:hypothetical protein
MLEVEGGRFENPEGNQLELMSSSSSSSVKRRSAGAKDAGEGEQQLEAEILDKLEVSAGEKEEWDRKWLVLFLTFAVSGTYVVIGMKYLLILFRSNGIVFAFLKFLASLRPQATSFQCCRTCPSCHGSVCQSPPTGGGRSIPRSATSAKVGLLFFHFFFKTKIQQFLEKE